MRYSTLLVWFRASSDRWELILILETGNLLVFFWTDFVKPFTNLALRDNGSVAKR